MAIACPACGKTSAVDIGAVRVCDRCGCDLSMLRDIRLAATANLRRAKAAFERGDWDAALECAEASWTLLHSEQSVAAACLASARLGDLAALERWRARERNLRETRTTTRASG